MGPVAKSRRMARSTAEVMRSGCTGVRGESVLLPRLLPAVIAFDNRF